MKPLHGYRTPQYPSLTLLSRYTELGIKSYLSGHSTSLHNHSTLSPSSYSNSTRNPIKKKRSSFSRQISSFQSSELFGCERMEDEKETEETPTRGNDWEVVSLTASAYAAAPGPDASPDAFDSPDNESSKQEDEVSRAMFMSGHFVFPPSQHENLPVERIDNEIDIEPGSEYASGVDMEGDKLESSVQVGQTYKEKEVVEDVHGIQFFDEKAKNIGRDTEFGAGKAVEGLNLVEEEQTLYTAQKYSSLLGEADITATTVRDEDLVNPTPSVFAEQNVDSSSDSSKSDSSKSLSPTKEKKSKGYNSPCEAWWKRQAASFYAQAKEANAFWSVFVAAALMGIVIIGHRWQQERWQNLQSNIGDEKVNRLMGPLSRFKDVLVGGHRQGSVIRGSASTER